MHSGHTQPASTSPKCIQDHPLCILLLQCTQVTHSQPLHPQSVSRITHCVFSYFSSLRSHTASLYIPTVYPGSPTVYSPTSVHSGHTQPASTSQQCIQDHPLCILLLQCTQVTHSQPLHPQSVSRITHCVFSYFSSLRSHTASLYIPTVYPGSPTVYSPTSVPSGHTQPASTSQQCIQDNISNYGAKNV